MSDDSSTIKYVKRPKRFDDDPYVGVKYRQVDVAADQASSNSTRLLLEKSKQLNYIKRGYYQRPHHHNHHYWSFVYFVNAPRGSAPLVFTESNKKIIPKSGMLVIFPGWVWHHVPKNGCDGRITLAGNLLPQLDNYGKVNLNHVTSSVTEINI